MPVTSPSTAEFAAPRSVATESTQLLGRQIFDAGSSIYIDPSAWSEVFERDGNQERWLSCGMPSVPPIPSIIFGFGRNALPRDHEPYSSGKQSETLNMIFWRIVEPFIKVLHQPWFARELELYGRVASTSQAEFEALLSVTHALTIAVLPPGIVQQKFRQNKDEMLQSLQVAAEKALAGANFLKSRSEVCFQAFLYYITLLFEKGQYDEAASLSGLALRLAQRLGLQYEPSNYNYTPWVSEMRRRMWNYAVHLDFRSLTTCAAETVTPLTLSREPRLPQNLDDDDWEACRFATRVSIRNSAVGFKETTFTIVRRQFAGIYRRITQTSISFETSQMIITQFRAQVEQIYLHHFDRGHPMHQFVASLIRQQLSLLDIVSRHTYLKQHKKSSRSSSISSIHRTSTLRPNTLRHDLFLRCLTHLEEASRLDAEYSERFKWQWIIRDPVPWHAIARILTDLSHWFEGPEVSRAWKQIDLVWQRYGNDNAGLVDTPIFQPLRSMREQAHFRLQRHLQQGGDEVENEEPNSDVPTSNHSSEPHEFSQPGFGTNAFSAGPAQNMFNEIKTHHATAYNQHDIFDMYNVQAQGMDLINLPFASGVSEEREWSPGDNTSL